MLRPYELAIALRYVRSRNKNRFISFISVISMAGIALAVAVLIMVLSVMNGFESEVRNRILQIVAHASITGLDGRISDWRSLAAVAGQDPEVQCGRPFRGWPGHAAGACRDPRRAVARAWIRPLSSRPPPSAA